MMRHVITIAVVLGLSAALLFAMGDGSVWLFGAPVTMWLLGLVFPIQWLAFAHAFRKQTERYYDLVGSLTFLATIWTCMLLAQDTTPRDWLLALLASVWAGRLGWFLFSRINDDGIDRRFNDIKPDFGRFLTAWTLQGAWVVITLLPVTAAITGTNNRGVSFWAFTGGAIWLVGFTFEALADHQKRVFRKDPGNADKFISTGLWSLSRHPNYFGEILLWTGMVIMAWPALTGFQHLAILSPLFVTLLLTRVSGIPMLETAANKKWGDDPAYKAYCRQTPKLLPKLF